MHAMRFLIQLCEIEDPHVHLSRLTQAVIDAKEAFDDNRTKSNLDAYWAAVRARDAFQEEQWPTPPEADVEVPSGYRGQHQAPDHISGAPLWDVTANGIYPEDFYSGHGDRHYGDPEDPSVYWRVVSFRGKPNGFLTVYRAVPKNPAIRTINSGDWITLGRRYAVEHGQSNLRKDYKILKKMVRPRDLFTDGDSLQEWGYDPQPPVKRRRGADPKVRTGGH